MKDALIRSVVLKRTRSATERRRALREGDGPPLIRALLIDASGLIAQADADEPRQARVAVTPLQGGSFTVLPADLAQ